MLFVCQCGYEDALSVCVDVGLLLSVWMRFLFACVAMSSVYQCECGECVDVRMRECDACLSVWMCGLFIYVEVLMCLFVCLDVLSVWMYDGCLCGCV